MKNFSVEKNRLVSELNSEIINNPNNEILKSLNQILKSYNSVSDLNGKLSRIIVDSLEHNLKIGEKLIQFENYFSDYSNAIQSTDLKKLAKYLIKENVKITYFGKAWSQNAPNWMYFDKVLDLKNLRDKMLFGENIIDHQNLDNKSGLESGFIDKKTGEGIMGKLKY